MKKLFGFGLVVILLALLGAVLARNEIARFGVQMGVTKATGFPLEIGDVDVGLFDSQLTVSNLTLMNPPDFPEKMFVDLPEFHFSYELASFFHGVPHIKEIVINLNKVVIVKNTDGESNVSRLEGVEPSDNSQALQVTDDAPAKRNKGSTKFQLDVAHVHIGTVVMKDYSKTKPTERTMTLNVDVTYSNITDSTDITRLALMTIMSQAHLPDVGVNLASLQKGLGPVQASATSAVKGAADATKGLFQKLKPAGQ
jgi:uncharacterized protein involved in outer membrane biogenesis